MRAIRNREYSYIWNGWPDGKKAYQAENMAGLTWKARLEAGKSDPTIQQRVDHYLHRSPEEFYSLKNDPCERRNLIDNPEYRERIGTMRARLIEAMKRTGDPFVEAAEQPGDRAVYETVIARLEFEHSTPGHGRSKKKKAATK